MSKILPFSGLLALLVPSLSASPAGGVDWEFVGSSNGSQPTARHEAGYVEVDGLFYLMGGRGSRPVDRFDPVAETWTNLGNPPIEMHHFQPVLFEDEIWVICAFQGGYPNETPIPNIYTYDPELNDWDVGPAIPGGRNRGAAGVVVYGEYIYVVGGNTMGHNGGFVPWFDRYHPGTNTWTALPDAPHARDHFVAAVIGNKLVCAGGRQTSQPNPTLGTVGPVDVFDFSTGTWSSLPLPIPTERAGNMAVARDEHLLVIGGESNGQAHFEAEAIDLNTGEWVILPELLDSRHGGGAVLWDDTCFVASGAGNNGGGPELTSQESLELNALLAQSETDLIDNGDFDDGTTGWTLTGGAALNLTEGGIRAPSIEIQNGAATRSAAGDFQETYTLTCLYEAVGASGTARIGIEYLDVASNVVGSDKVDVANTSGLTSFHLTGTSPADARGVRVELYADGARTLRVDDVVVVDTPSEVVRLGVPPNPLALPLSGVGPVLGSNWNPVIDHTDFAPGAPTDFLAIGVFPGNFPTGFGTVLVANVLPLISGPAGQPFLLPLPLDPVLIGLQLSVQGISVDGSVPVLTNALDATLQKP